MFFQKMAICESLILAIFGQFWLFWAIFGLDISKEYLFQHLGAKRTMESQKVGPFDYLENWAPQVPQIPPWAQKHP